MNTILVINVGFKDDNFNSQDIVIYSKSLKTSN